MPFADVVGHARPLGLLSRSIARGSLPPSLLFTGPEGVGKRLVARAVAQALNCIQPSIVDGQPSTVDGRRSTPDGERSTVDGHRLTVDGHRLTVDGERLTVDGQRSSRLPLDACGTCPACKRIARGTHPDVVVIEAGANAAIKIEPIREVIAAAGYRPFEGRRRVVIIDEAERVTPDAQDALLKNLEEPPASSVFILVSARPETLLSTVRSRCSRLRFGRLAASEVARLLVERHEYDEREAYAAAAVANGSPGRALEAGSRAFQDARDAALGALRAVAGARSPRDQLGAASLLLSGKSTSAREREELGTRLQMLGSLLRDVALLSNGAPADAAANGDLGGDLSELADRMGGERAMRAFAVADRAAAALGRNANPKIVACWLAVRL